MQQQRAFTRCRRTLERSSADTDDGVAAGKTRDRAGEVGRSATDFGPGASRPVIRGIGGDRVRVLENGIGTLDVSNIIPDHGIGLEPLVVDPAYNHGALRWDASGRRIVFQRFSLSTAGARPEIWTVDVDTGALELIAENAYLPAWVP